jgi:formyl-CoA transferase
MRNCAASTLFSDFTPHITGAPLPGEHSSQVLTELGYTATQITDMVAAHTIRTQ